MFKLTSNLDDCTRRLDNLTASKLPSATRNALNDTIRVAKQGVVEEMKRVFDRPTPYTLNAFKFVEATKDNLVATVLRKDQVVGKHYLEVQEAGGVRPATALEKLLRSRLPIAFAGIVPADSARLDRYGNWSSGQRNEVLSGLGAQRDPTANRSAASLKRKKNPSKYFVPIKGLKTPGVYERKANGQLHILLLLTTAMPTYTARFDFQPAAEAAAKGAFPQFFAQRMAEAIASAR